MDGEARHESSDLGKRSVESAILAIVVETHPAPLPWSALLGEMTAEVGGPERLVDVERAVEGLVAVGLLRIEDGDLSPTPASLRAAELELGL